MIICQTCQKVPSYHNRNPFPDLLNKWFMIQVRISETTILRKKAFFTEISFLGNKIHYMFGGNPGSSARSPHGANTRRLDDFWSAKLLRPNSEEVLRKCQFLIRAQKFREMLPGNPIDSLGFLRKEVISQSFFPNLGKPLLIE